MTDRWLKIALAIAGLALLVVQIYITPSPDPRDIKHVALQSVHRQVWTGRMAPELEVPMLDGSTFRLADHVGQRVIVLNFFATWCGPCRMEMPELQRYVQALAREQAPVVFVAIDVEEKRGKVEDFIKELSFALPVGLDESGDLARKYGVEGYPTTVVIGADGRVKLFETGAISNADVSLSPFVHPQIDHIRHGQGISRDNYRKVLATEPNTSPEPAEPKGVVLEGRARRIADTMICPCGCSDTVSHCNCHTATAIKEKLAAGGFDAQKTDAEVMTALNREFCMKGM